MSVSVLVGVVLSCEPYVRVGNVIVGYDYRVRHFACLEIVGLEEQLTVVDRFEVVVIVGYIGENACIAVADCVVVDDIRSRYRLIGRSRNLGIISDDLRAARGCGINNRGDTVSRINFGFLSPHSFVVEFLVDIDVGNGINEYLTVELLIVSVIIAYGILDILGD